MPPQLPSRWLAGLLAVLSLVSVRADETVAVKPDVEALLSELEAKSPKDWVPALIAENNVWTVALKPTGLTTEYTE